MFNVIISRYFFVGLWCSGAFFEKKKVKSILKKRKEKKKEREKRDLSCSAPVLEPLFLPLPLPIAIPPPSRRTLSSLHSTESSHLGSKVLFPSIRNQWLQLSSLLLLLVMLLVNSNFLGLLWQLCSGLLYCVCWGDGMVRSFFLSSPSNLVRIWLGISRLFTKNFVGGGGGWFDGTRMPLKGGDLFVLILPEVLGFGRGSVRPRG